MHDGAIIPEVLTATRSKVAAADPVRVRFGLEIWDPGSALNSCRCIVEPEPEPGSELVRSTPGPVQMLTKCEPNFRLTVLLEMWKLTGNKARIGVAKCAPVGAIITLSESIPFTSK